MSIEKLNAYRAYKHVMHRRICSCRNQKVAGARRYRTPVEATVVQECPPINLNSDLSASTIARDDNFSFTVSICTLETASDVTLKTRTRVQGCDSMRYDIF